MKDKITKRTSIRFSIIERINYYFSDPLKKHNNSIESVKETEKQSEEAASLSDFQSSYKGDNSPLLRRSSRVVDAALGHGIARTMGNSEVRAYAETPPGLSAEHTPSPFFPKNLRCANLFWEPYSFTCKANLVSPWAFAQGLYQLPFVLSQE